MQDVVAAYIIESEQAVSLPISGNAKIIDLQGNPVPTTVKDGMLDVTLTETPIYIYGIDCVKLAQHIKLDVDFDVSHLTGAQPTSVRPDGTAVLDQPLKFRLDFQNFSGLAVQDAAATAIFEPSPTGFKPVVIPLSKTIADKALHQQICAIPLNADEWRPFMNTTINMTVTCRATTLVVPDFLKKK